MFIFFFCCLRAAVKFPIFFTACAAVKFLLVPTAAAISAACAAFAAFAAFAFCTTATCAPVASLAAGAGAGVASLAAGAVNLVPATYNSPAALAAA